MDMEIPAQKKVVEAVMKKLEENGFADNDWDESNLIEQSYKEQGLKRYKKLFWSWKYVMFEFWFHGKLCYECCIECSTHDRIDVKTLGRVRNIVKENDALLIYLTFQMLLGTLLLL